MTAVLHSKWLLLGESPAAGTEYDRKSWLAPGSSASADRLLKFTGFTAQDYLDTFTRDNLLHHLPRRSGKGRNFPLSSARLQVRRVFREHELARGFILLGKRIASAFHWYQWGSDFKYVPMSKLDYLEWYKVIPAVGWACPTLTAIVPHPSGVNRWWNDENNRRRARRFFRELKA
jgi:hypothetical protein